MLSRSVWWLVLLTIQPPTQELRWEVAFWIRIKFWWCTQHTAHVWRVKSQQWINTLIGINISASLKYAFLPLYIFKGIHWITENVPKHYIQFSSHIPVYNQILLTIIKCCWPTVIVWPTRKISQGSHVGTLIYSSQEYLLPSTSPFMSHVLLYKSQKIIYRKKCYHCR